MILETYAMIILNKIAMFTIEKPKEIHLSSWKKMFENSQINNENKNINFDLFWSSSIKEECHTFSAKNEGDFMGFAAARVHESFITKYLYLEILFVDPAFRKLGVGTALLNKLEETSSNLGLDFYIYNVEKTNLVARRLLNSFKKIDKIIFEKKFD